MKQKQINRRNSEAMALGRNQKIQQIRGEWGKLCRPIEAFIWRCNNEREKGPIIIATIYFVKIYIDNIAIVPFYVFYVWKLRNIQKAFRKKVANSQRATTKKSITYFSWLSNFDFGPKWAYWLFTFSNEPRQTDSCQTRTQRRTALLQENVIIFRMNFYKNCTHCGNFFFWSNKFG